MKFGTRAAAFPEPNTSNDGDVWVRTFSQPSTVIRIAEDAYYDEEKGREVEGTEAWYKELEHYDRAGFRRSFPCPVPHGTPKEKCPGCTHPDEEVRRRTAKWYFNALDDKDYLRVYKIGVKLLRKFKLREQRIGTVSDRDYEVIRSGKDFNEIEYDLEAGDKGPRDKMPEKLHDIPEILSRSWQEALDYYSGKTKNAENDAEEDAPLRERRTESASARSGLKEKLEAERAARAETKSKAEEPEEAAETSWQDWGKNPEEEDIKMAETSDIKAWLSSMDVEFPNRAPRSRLISMAIEKAKEPPF